MARRDRGLRVLVVPFGARRGERLRAGLLPGELVFFAQRVDRAAQLAPAKGGIQTVEYSWYNPVTGKMERKVAFVEKVDADIRCSVGSYKAQ